jgi:hypothetical protein
MTTVAALLARKNKALISVSSDTAVADAYALWRITILVL